MDLYQNLPAPPSQFSAGTLLARLVDSIGYRYYLATQGLTQNEIEFRPVESSMSMMELLHHIYSVLFWSYKAFNREAKYNKNLSTFEEYHQETLQACSAFSAFLKTLSDQDIEKTTVYLKRTDTTYSFWYLINGPVTDVLTHIGQINTWRRIAGNPCPRISPFTGEAY